MKQYIVDGYNLLFLVGFPGEDLQSQRNALIATLARLQHLPITLVFDSQYQKGDCTLAHQRKLSIIYTNEGETADEHILHLIESLPSPQHTTIVTSDKRLACKARNLGTKTEEVKSFFENITQKKKARVKKHSPAPITPQPPKIKESSQDYYLKQFQRPTDAINTKKTIIDNDSPPEKIESEFARWLRLFNKNEN